MSSALLQPDQTHYDVIVVGGGPAGAAAAYDLATAGLSVLVVDKHTFPRFKPCAGGLTIKALQRLRYSVDPVVRYRSDVMEISLNLKRKTLLHAPSDICALTVRTELDDFCLQKTLAQGATFLKIQGVHGITSTSEGVTLSLKGGERLTARYLIGADGAHSQVRKLTSAFSPDRTAVAIEGIVPVERCTLPAQFTFDFGVIKQGYGWLFPKGDHINVGIYTRRPEEVTLNKAMVREYAKHRLGTEQVEHVCGYPIGTGGERLHQAHDRVFLVGDAAGYAEALLGEGLHNAIKSGQIAANAIIVGDANGVPPRVLINHYMEDVRGDLDNSRKVAKLFYKFLPISFGLLKHGVSRTLMQGFAAGFTLTECKRALLTASPDFNRNVYLARSGPFSKTDKADE